MQTNPRGISFTYVLNRNANVSNHRMVAYAWQVGCAILPRNKEVNAGSEMSSSVANAEFQLERCSFWGLMNVAEYRV